MRGWNRASKGKPWEMVGTGRKLAALNAWLAKDVLPFVDEQHGKRAGLVSARILGIHN
jgi:hypothetical protein